MKSNMIHHLCVVKVGKNSLINFKIENTCTSSDILKNGQNDGKNTARINRNLRMR